MKGLSDTRNCLWSRILPLIKSTIETYFAKQLLIKKASSTGIFSENFAKFLRTLSSEWLFLEVDLNVSFGTTLGWVSIKIKGLMAYSSGMTPSNLRNDSGIGIYFWVFKKTRFVERLRAVVCEDEPVVLNDQKMFWLITRKLKFFFTNY